MTLHCIDIDPEAGTVMSQAKPDTPLPGAGFRWVHWDLAEPGLASWAATHLPDRVAVALLQTETRPRCFAEDEGLVTILRGVNFNPGDTTDDMVSLRCYAGRNLLVTVRVRRVFSVVALRDALKEGMRPASPVDLLVRLVEALTDRIEAESLSLEDQIDDLEEAGFEDRHPDARALARLRRAAIRLGRFARPQAMALDEAARLTATGPDGVTHRFHEAANRTRRADELLEAARHRMTALADHLDMAQAARMGRNGYLLSVIAAVFLPLGFLTGLFGVNVGGMPGVESTAAFWWLTAAMILIGLGVAAILRWMRLF